VGAKSDPMGRFNRIIGLQDYVVVMTICGVGRIDNGVVILTLLWEAQAGSAAVARYWISGTKKDVRGRL